MELIISCTLFLQRPSELLEWLTFRSVTGTWTGNEKANGLLWGGRVGGGW